MTWIHKATTVIFQQNEFELFHHHLDEVELNKIKILHLTFTVPL